MQVLKIKSIPNIFNCIFDDFNVFVLTKHQSLVRLYQFDIETFELVNYVDLVYRPVFNSPIGIDSDSLYLPAIDGRILCIDKFSGDLITNIDLGMSLPDKYLKIEEHIYASIAIPVNNTLIRESIDTYSFIRCNKQGNKELQSQKFKNISNVIEIDNKLYFYDNLRLCQVNKDLEFENQTKLHFPSKQVLTWNKNIISIAENGAIEIFDQNLKFTKNLMVGKIIAECCVLNNILLVPCFNSIVFISSDHNIKNMRPSSVIPKYLCDNFWICENGEILKLENESLVSEKIYNNSFKCFRYGENFIGWNEKELLKCSL